MITSVGQEMASTVLNGSLLAALPIALLAGLVSFASPCVLPLIPGYVGYLTGMAGVESDSRKGSRPRLLLGVLLFILGFSVVFVGLSVVVSSIGAAQKDSLDLITRILGVFIILMGLVFMGSVPFLQRDRRVHVSPKAGLAGAPVLGVAFGLGWAPCIGPTLAAVLTLSLSDGTQARGAILAFVYCLGLGIPFLLVALFFERSTRLLAWLRKYRRALMTVGGLMLIVLGFLLVTGYWARITALMQGWIDGFWVAV